MDASAARQDPHHARRCDLRHEAVRVASRSGALRCGDVADFFTLAKRLFRRRDFAFLAAALLALDTMHFTQTRIATVDVFILFFILLMVLFMTDYIQMDYMKEPLKKLFLPLGACGVSFGLGVASKWTGLYAGAGLAVMFFAHMIRAGIACRKDTAARREFWRRTWATVGFCCVFFLAIPALIYYLSYIPFFRYEATKPNGVGSIALVLQQQESMYHYHHDLTATHTCQSAWYEWPFTSRSVWFYFRSLGENRVSSISSTGSPAVWWVSAIGAILLAVEALFRRTKKESAHWKQAGYILLIAIAANYLPWTLVPRCTFQYHFFTTFPFVVLAAILFCSTWKRAGKCPERSSGSGSSSPLRILSSCIRRLRGSRCRGSTRSSLNMYSRVGSFSSARFDRVKDVMRQRSRWDRCRIFICIDFKKFGSWNRSRSCRYCRAKAPGRWHFLQYIP